MEEYGEEPTVFFDVEKGDEEFLRTELVRDSAQIDEMIEDIRGITDIDSG